MITDTEKMEVLLEEQLKKQKKATLEKEKLDAAMRTYNFASEAEAYSFIQKH